MKNQQAHEPRVRSDGKTLQLNSIFHTVQGEGPHAGRPAIFIRLAGCNLQCPACDTEYTLRSPQTPESIVAAAYRMSESSGTKLAVITGGEPFRQNIRRLVATLRRHGWSTQIETNGVLPIDELSMSTYHSYSTEGSLDIVMSPKTGRVYYPMWGICRYVKYVVHKDNVADDGLPITALRNPLSTSTDRVARPPYNWKGTIYVNPEDSGNASVNKKNMQAALDAVMNYADDRRVLGVQMHKLYGVE